jgi:hypothetical protein
MQMKRWMENGCDQCWSCENRIGESKGDHTFPGRENHEVVILPECRVTGKYMTEVYSNPCRKYTQQAGELPAEEER